MHERVLIVDDERTIAQLTAMWMELAGYVSIIAYDGRSALAAAIEHVPDLILLDIRMPDVDGFEVNRRLKGTPGYSSIPVIFLSAHAQESSREEAVAAGAARFLSKPYEYKDLIVAARAALAPPHVPKHAFCGAGT